MKKIKLGYFTQFDIQISTTFIYDLINELQSRKDLSVLCYNGGSKKNALLGSKSIGYSDRNIKQIYRKGKLISFFFNVTEQQYILRRKQKQALRLLKKHVNASLSVAYVEFATTAVLLMDYFNIQKIPFVVHVHGYDITEKLNNKSYAEEVQRLFVLADRFITASKYMKRRLILLGCPEHKIEVIRYGVEDKRVEVVPWKDRNISDPSIIFLGRLTPKKSPIALVHAFNLVLKEMPQAELSIIGDGPQRKEVEALIEKLGISNSIRLYGALNREESFPILREHWVYAQHSVTPISGDTEGFAISLAEAALHELPVVSTIHNGITENVIDGKTGFLVPEYDYEAMAEKMIELLQNPELCEKMGKKGRKSILSRNRQEVRVNKIKNLLKEVASKN